MEYDQNFDDCLDYEYDEIEFEMKNVVKEGAEKRKENEETNINDNQPSVKELNSKKQKEDEKKVLIKRLDKIKEQLEKTKQELMLKKKAQKQAIMNRLDKIKLKQETEMEKLRLKIISQRLIANAWTHRPAKTYSRNRHYSSPYSWSSRSTKN